MKHPVAHTLLWIVGLLVVSYFYGDPGSTVWVFGSIGLWFLGQMVKGRRDYVRNELAKATENGLRAAGMPADYRICKWSDCPTDYAHGHPFSALYRYPTFTAWQHDGAPED